jgi:hypothetical protein
MIMHIAPLDKFIPPFIQFVNSNFDNVKHRFFVLKTIKKQEQYQLPKNINNLYLITGYFKNVFAFFRYLYQSEKIIIHGLFSRALVLLLFLQPWLLKKCYWVMWGGDFYFPEKQSWLKKQVIKRMGHFITYIKGDYELVQKWYGANGEYHECFMYSSNLYKEYNIKPKEHDTINIQLGNSADPTNNHIEVLQSLVRFKDENIQIFVPLSYGNKDYAEEVITYGKELFGDKFVALTEFMPFETYLEFLSEIDIAIFAHKRQQAMGNTITLLGLGKKVYLDSKTVQFDFFKKHDVEIFDVNDIDLQILNQKKASENKEKIKYLFSKEVLLDGLQRIFND